MATGKKRTLTEIEDQIAKLKREAEELRAEEVAEVVQKIKAAIEAYGLTAADLGFRGGALAQPRSAARKGPRAGREGAHRGQVAVKYRDENGNTWTGRGNKPRWLSAALTVGKKLEDFQVG